MGLEIQSSETRSITHLLTRWRCGDEEAFERLVPLVTTELRRIAKYHLDRQARGATWQPTALVQEFFARLLSDEPRPFRDRSRFFAFAATTMRNILIDRARARRTAKHGHGLVRVPLDAAAEEVEARREVDILALDKALDALDALDARQRQIVELRAFTGLSLKQTAEVLGVSEPTVSRDWAAARAWLFRYLSERAVP